MTFNVPRPFEMDASVELAKQIALCSAPAGWVGEFITAKVTQPNGADGVGVGQLDSVRDIRSE